MVHDLNAKEVFDALRGLEHVEGDGLHARCTTPEVLEKLPTTKLEREALRDQLIALQTSVACAGLELTRWLGAGAEAIVLAVDDVKDGARTPRALKLFDPAANATVGVFDPPVGSVWMRRIPRDFTLVPAIPAELLECVDGQTLGDWLNATTDARSRLVQFKRLVDGVAGLTDGLTHRDLKPDNLGIDGHGALKVLDYGLFAHAPNAREERARRRGGTMGYGAYEQLCPIGRPEATDVGPKSDVFALGVLLFEFLAVSNYWNAFGKGRKVEWLELIAKHRPTVEQMARELAPHVDGTPFEAHRLATAIDACTMLQVAKRWDARKLADALDAILEDSNHARSGSRKSQRASKPTRDQRERLLATRDATASADTLGRALDIKGVQLKLADVHIRLSIRPLEGARHDRRALHAVESGTDFIEATKKHRFFVIKGVGGSGKTTVLRFYANALARDLLGERIESNDQSACIPVAGAPEPLFVRLRDVIVPEKLVASEAHASQQNAFNEILEAWLHANALRYPIPQLVEDLRNGRVVLLLDGLDEVVPDAHRAALARAIAAFAKKVATRSGKDAGADTPIHARIVVSSRPAAIENIQFPEDHFETAEVLPLRDEDIGRFAVAWTRLAHGCESEDDVKVGSVAEEKCKSIAKALEVRQNRALFELAHNPLMLTLIVLVHHLHGDLPAQRVALYDQAVDALLRKYKGDAHWSVRRVRECLAEVAWRTFVEAEVAEKGVAASEQTVGWIADHIGIAYGDADRDDCMRRAREFLDADRSKGVLLEVASDPREKFLHRSLREFLAGWHLANLDRAKRLKHFRAGAKASQRDRHELLRMMAGILASRGSGPALEFVRDILGRNVKPSKVKPFAERKDDIAAAMSLLADMRSFDPLPVVLAPIEADMASLLGALESRDTPLDERIAFTEALGTFGDPRLRPCTSTSRREYDEHERRYGRWCWVGKGTFLYGAHPDLKETKIERDFSLQRWPVTIEEFARFVDDGGYLDARWWSAGGKDQRVQWLAPEAWEQQRTKASNHPVVGVSWYEAKAYCEWLTEVDGHRRDGWRIDLPTDDEWEASARGLTTLRASRRDHGEKNPQPNRDYAWTHELEQSGEPQWDASRANTADTERTGRVGTTPVGCFPAGHGPHGHWDLCGNVWEWCDDAVSHENDARDRPYWRCRLTPGGSARALRGGGFLDDADYARVSLRFGFVPSVRYDVIGFRPSRVSSG